MRYGQSTGALAFLGAAILAVPAQAQSPCPEGRTVSGECVNAALAASTRQLVVVFSQPKISYTAFPILPNDDMMYRYPHQLIPNPLDLSSGSPAGRGGGGIFFFPFPFHN